jgi:diguanylate cyclase
VTADPLPSAAVTIVAIALLAALISIGRSRPQVVSEHRVWRMMLLAVAIVSASALAAQGVAALGLPADVRHLVFSTGCLAACAPTYQALVQWNRSRTGMSDPSESLNGLSAVLVLAALGNLILARVGPEQPEATAWQTQVSLLVACALLVLLGTAASVSVIGGLIHDRRLWLVGTALGLVTGTELVALFVGDHSLAVTMPIWLFGGGLIASCALILPGAVTVRSATDQATIMGALLVQSVGIVLLTVDNQLQVDGNLLATEYAAAGVIGASVRVLQLVRDLAHLTRTRHQAMTDELTGIPNRRALLMAIDDALPSAHAASLLIVDLDRFKEINDRYGHAAGDRLLRHTAQAFAAQLPAGAFLSRLGGDEFAVLLTDSGCPRAADLALDLARAAAAPLSDLKGRLLQVGASIGIATVELPGVGGGELLRRADTAMYQAKTSRSGIRVYDSALDAAAQERLELTEELRLALKGPASTGDQIVVHFQPQLNIGTAAVVGAEALVRWRHPRLGLLAPDHFIDLAEQNGLMPALTERVLREATDQAAHWRNAGHRLRVSVNLSAAGLASGGLLALIDEVLAVGMPARDLVLEVTETSLMKDPTQALESMNRIAARGIGISIDDYGTGYSSLSYLNDLPATELKIDRCFTARATSDPRTAAIVAGTVELAHRLGIRLIAEGVEDDATLAMLTELGCDDSQGYLHSRPLPAEEFRSWLDTRAAAAFSPSAPPVPAAS